MEHAGAQSAKFRELRAATRLARLWHSLGKTTEAHDLLKHFPIIPDQFAPRRNLPAVIAGLDPVIHLSGEISRVSGPPDQVRG